MNSDDTIRELRRLMYTATVGEETKPLVVLLHMLRDMLGRDHAFTLSMAIAIGLEVATNPAIPEDQREIQLQQMLDMVRMAYERGKAGVAEGGDERE